MAVPVPIRFRSGGLRTLRGPLWGTAALAARDHSVSPRNGFLVLTLYTSFTGTLNSLRQLRQLPLPTTRYDSLRQPTNDSLRQLTHVITATTATTAYDSLRQPSDNDSYDSIRQMYDSLRQLRQLRQPGLKLIRPAGQWRSSGRR